jgi:hypothetical protein
MPLNNVTKNSVEINGQSSINPTKQDQTMFLLAKLKALLDLGTNCDFALHTTASWHGYLCVLFDLVEQLEVVIA